MNTPGRPERGLPAGQAPSGDAQAPGARIMTGRRNLYGYDIGILMIEASFPRPPGAVGNALSFDFPVLHHVVPGATSDATVHALGALEPGSAPYRAALAPWLDGARALERQGVRAITSSCGFTALIQEELAQAVSVPVFASSLLMVPMIARMLPPAARVGVVTASLASLSERHLRAAGIDPARVALAGLDDCPLFQDMTYRNRHEVDFAVVEAEVCAAVHGLLAGRPEVRALMLECSLLPPYAAAIQRRTGLPVFDYATFVNHVHAALNRTPYASP